jgi:hypothetical protein
MSILNAILNRARRAERLPVIFLLALGIAIIFWQVLILGYVQVPGDIPAAYDPVMREAIPDLVRPQNPLLSDHINQFYVWHTLAAQGLQETGTTPLWNPYMLAGQPLLANAQPALFYPPNLLLRWLDAGHVASIRSIFNLLVAGIFTFLFARAVRISKMGATLSAIAFAFSGALIVGPGHAYANVLVWLPMTLWAGEKLVSGRRPTLWALVTSIGVALSILGGHPESSFHNILVLALYVIARLLTMQKSGRWKLRTFVIFAASLIGGAMLSAIQWLPFVAWWIDSATPSRSSAWTAESVFYSSEWLRNLPLLLTLLFPGFFGSPHDWTYFWPFDNFQNYLEQAMYFGLIPAVLAAGAVVSSERKKYAALGIIALMALILLAIGLRLPGFELFNHLPVLDRVNNERLKWYFSLFGAVLAGFGLDMLLASLRREKLHDSRFIYAVTAVFGFGLFVLASIMAARLLWGTFFEADQRIFLQHLVFEIFAFSQVRSVVSGLVLVCGAGVVFYGLLARRAVGFVLLPYLLIALTFVELVVHAYGYNTILPAEQVLPPVRLTETLAQDEGTFRILAMEPAFWPNYGAAYGLSHIGGYDLPVHKRSSELYLAQGGSGYRQKWLPEWPLVDWMNVKYVISPVEQNLDKLELVYGDGYYLYENKDVLPRAYMVYNVQVLQDDEQLLATLTGGEFDFARTVLLEETLPARQQVAVGAPQGDPGGELDSVHIVNFANDVVEMEVETPKDGVLVMSDVLAPGWRAAVDGEPVHLVRANYAFRAIFVPEGKHRVVFRYDPLDYRLGFALSALGLVLLVVGPPGAWALWKRAKEARTGSPHDNGSNET